MRGHLGDAKIVGLLKISIFPFSGSEISSGEPGTVKLQDRLPAGVGPNFQGG
jgi:hypothetical protein